MIKVLQNCQEVNDAVEFLNSHALPKHGHTAEKNWDLFQLYSVAKIIPLGGKVIDLGCGNLFAMNLLYAMGFRKLYGIDLSAPFSNRLNHLCMMLRNHSLRLPLRLYKGDLTKTIFPEQMFDLAVCLSVIEHGVDIEKFFFEAYRLLKPGGILFITTDYWEPKIDIQPDNRPFNLAWKVFSKTDIDDIITIAYKSKFSLYLKSAVPPCSDKCVVWNRREYTFLEMVFKK